MGVESTVISFEGEDGIRLLRPGFISAEDLMEITPNVLIDKGVLEKLGENVKVRSPGMKYKHYAPKAEMIIFQGEPENIKLAMAEEKMKRNFFGQRVEIIVFDNEHPETAAHEFFARLRECDKKNVDVILAAALREDGIGFAVMNRMFKSAGYNIREV